MRNKSGLHGPLLVLSFGLLCHEAACTFYTACPAGNGNAAGSGNSMAGSGNSMAGAGSVIVDKAPPPGKWLNVTPDLGDLKDTCGPFFNLTVYPDRDEVIAGVYYGLWSTKDGGGTWAPLGTGEGSEPTRNRMSQITFDPAKPDGFWEVGIYGDAFFRTDDAGETFKRIGDLTHLDSIGIDLSDPKRKTMLASKHEQPILYKSSDGGKTWDDIYDNLPEKTKHCSYSLVQDASTFLMSCGGGSEPGDPKIVRTTDGGDTWNQIHDGGGGTLPLEHSDGSIYWAEETGALAQSTDKGATWKRVVQASFLLPIRPVELPDGRIASISDLAVVVSADGGASWKKASAALPFKDPTGFVYSSFQRAFFISRLECYATPTGSKGDELMRFDFDYERY